MNSKRKVFSNTASTGNEVHERFWVAPPSVDFMFSAGFNLKEL